jgi:hypothetical protein
MQADIGDRLVVKGHHIGETDREAVVLEVHGQGGAPPFRVRWSDGHESVFVPSSDTIVEHRPTSTSSA